MREGRGVREGRGERGGYSGPFTRSAWLGLWFVVYSFHLTCFSIVLSPPCGQGWNEGPTWVEIPTQVCGRTQTAIVLRSAAGRGKKHGSSLRSLCSLQEY